MFSDFAEWSSLVNVKDNLLSAISLKEKLKITKQIRITTTLGVKHFPCLDMVMCRNWASVCHWWNTHLLWMSAWREKKHWNITLLCPALQGKPSYLFTSILLPCTRLLKSLHDLKVLASIRHAPQEFGWRTNQERGNWNQNLLLIYNSLKGNYL